MAPKPKKTTSKRTTSRKATSTKKVSSDLSLDDLESVTGGVVLQVPRVGAVAATLPMTNCCSDPSALLGVDVERVRLESNTTLVSCP